MGIGEGEVQDVCIGFRVVIRCKVEIMRKVLAEVWINIERV